MGLKPHAPRGGWYKRIMLKRISGALRCALKARFDPEVLEAFISYIPVAFTCAHYHLYFTAVEFLLIYASVWIFYYLDNEEIPLVIERIEELYVTVVILIALIEAITMHHMAYDKFFVLGPHYLFIFIASEIRFLSHA